MDYVSAFQNLKTNNKYERKSPHKAILLLAIMDMIERNLLSENEIVYNETLIESFQQVWNKALPQEATFYSTVYFPFWHLQSEEFWHIIPVRGKEEAFQSLRENRIKPTESKVKELIRCAVLDEDLFFMMTIPSGRTALRRVLLENYTSLSPRQINKLSASTVSYQDASEQAMKEYQDILQSSTPSTAFAKQGTNNEESHFNELADDLQIVMAIEYYTFLKKHPLERDLFREICPSVCDLYYHIKYSPYKKGETSYSISIAYENFLYDLRIALMGEDGSLDLIDSINNAIAILRGESLMPEESSISADVSLATEAESSAETEASEMSVVEAPKLDRMEELRAQLDLGQRHQGSPWKAEEVEYLELCYKAGWSIEMIAIELGRTERGISMRLAKLGYPVEVKDNPVDALPLPKVVEEMPTDIKVVNANERCFIYQDNVCVFSAPGSIKILRGNPYRFNYKPGYFTIKAIEYTRGKWRKGDKLLVADSKSELYKYMERVDCSVDDVDDFIERPNMSDNRLKFAGVWYGADGQSL